jgi:hypothetical protein
MWLGTVQAPRQGRAALAAPEAGPPRKPALASPLITSGRRPMGAIRRSPKEPACPTCVSRIAVVAPAGWRGLSSSRAIVPGPTTDTLACGRIPERGVGVQANHRASREAVGLVEGGSGGALERQCR